MITVTLLKDHLDNKEGDSIEVTDEQGNYFVRCGVAEVKEEKAVPPPEPKKEPVKSVEPQPVTPAPQPAAKPVEVKKEVPQPAPAAPVTPKVEAKKPE